MKHHHPSEKGAFTLIELLVVIAIIAILAGLSFPAFSVIQKNARLKKAQMECHNLANAVKLFETEYGYYPSADASGTLNADLVNVLSGTESGPSPLNTKKIRYFDFEAARLVPGVGYMNPFRSSSSDTSFLYRFAFDQGYAGFVSNAGVPPENVTNAVAFWMNTNSSVTTNNYARSWK